MRIDGSRTTKPFSAKAPNPKSPAAYFAAQGHSVQKSAKSEPGVKARSLSADLTNVPEHLIGTQTLPGTAQNGRGYGVKPSSTVPSSPKASPAPPLKIQSRTASGRDTPNSGRSQVANIPEGL